MTQEDVLIRATVGDARVYAVTTTHLTQYMNKIHGLSPVAAAALGRTAAGALLLAATMKDGEGVTIRFKGNGPLVRSWPMPQIIRFAALWNIQKSCCPLKRANLMLAAV